VIGVRHRLAHRYDDMGNERVWAIIRDFLPAIRRDVERLLQEAEDEWRTNNRGDG
jgi:uncharacterized protein with HEPN domain